MARYRSVPLYSRSPEHAVRSTFNQLAVLDRQLVLMHECDKLNPAEMAAVAELAPGEVVTRLNSALGLLQDAVRRRHGQRPA